MPANLPAEAKAAWLKVMEAKTPEEKIRAMEEFLSYVPKHKGTEKLIKHIRRRMAELKREVQERREKARSIRSGGARIYVAKEGDLQVAVVGPPSSGKTALLTCLTNTPMRPDDLPFSTVEPVPSMFIEDGVYVQLVKTPSIVLDQQSDLNTIALATVRNADAVLLTVGANASLEAVEKIFRFFEDEGVYLYPPKNYVRIERRGLGGVQIIGSGQIIGGTSNDVKRLLNEYGIYHAVVYIQGSVTLDDVEEALYLERQYKPTIAVVTMSDLYPAEELAGYFAKRGIVYHITDLRRCVIDRRRLLEDILKATGRIRVFTKPVHSKTYVEKPIIVKAGATVGEVAALIHSSLLQTFKYAVVWKRESFPQRPKRVGRDYALSDNDVVEIHA
ncbi:TGS domain-containing protein [Pyrobaculum neutrophilum]|uniref:TGS domain protein n=1 Tax=Pyrobaculum neutrophilum (strain DSM 2338 / JCM 9278 / NBRC 100436 / V24Sta) TaxID=444157 RepID=B1YCX3_PYRNV|nr:TGS domain-containing protein [Pyrobaculum neutrophilum]ACB39636.1 TGS domain protein [Pyrobaculum neutrophilum V24Sta]